MRPGAVYLAGKQVSGGYYLAGAAIINAANVAALIVIMNGATIRFKNGLKFGMFDPSTGNAIYPTLPFDDHSKAATMGVGIEALNVGYFEVRGGTIDGNSQNAIIGGLWGDTGRQLAHFGIYASGCGNVLLEDVQVFNSCLDGFLYGYDALGENEPAHPFAMKRRKADKVARNCLSIVGTNSALIEQCEFSRAGQAENVGLGSSFGSSPASCLDVEAEASICRNVVVRNSRLIAGARTGTAFVADSGDSADLLVEDTLLVGNVWTNKPRTIFSRCAVYGVFGKLRGGMANARDNTRFVDGYFSDTHRFEAAPVNPLGSTNFLGIDLQGAGGGVVFERSSIDIPEFSDEPPRRNLQGCRDYLPNWH